MFGNEFAEIQKALHTYMIKYGEEAIVSRIKMLLWDESLNGLLTLSSFQIRDEQEDDHFVSGIQDLYQVEMIKEDEFGANNRNEYVAAFFEDLFNKMININTEGDHSDLHLYLYIPLYDEKVWKQASGLIDVLNHMKSSFHIDIIGLASDTAFLFTPEDKKETLPEYRKEYDQRMPQLINLILDYKKNYPGSISHFLILQNNQQDGLSLELDQESFIRIVGEFALLTTEHYYNLFLYHTSENESNVTAIGLSLLYFDKYYFVQYLLKRTYLHILNRERITDTKVDISKATKITQEKLRNKTTLVSDFYDNHVKPLLLQNIDKSSIIADITPLTNQLVEDTKVDLQSFLSERDMSLPEKKATLATLLGFDDPLLTGYDFNHDLLILDDIDQEAAEAFIAANNSVLNSSNSSYASLSINGEEAYLPLKEIKELRRKIRESTNYIRENEEQLFKIKKQKENADEAEKRLTEDGYFIYKGNRFRLIPQEVKEHPLAETYSPQAQRTSGVDLRDHFTRIKNQGTQGACSAFTLSAIYEYILKRNKALDEDLSEAFLYYNARKKVNNEQEDSGCSYMNSVTALTEYGICTESLFPYDEKIFNSEPPQMAYEDAQNRLVKQAKNVKVSLEDIKSALEEGYPVAISLQLYDSFSANYSGFVCRPTEEEINSKKFGNHAMVICGFSEDKKIFIVRNSWGEDFGDKGYCYIPYSYIGDSSLVNMACIITEIGGDYKVVTEGKQVQAFFDTSDANIQYAILNNLINEEKFLLLRLLKQEGIYREKYYRIISNLRKNSIRTKITAGTKLYLQEKIENYGSLQNQARSEKEQKLNTFDNKSNKIIVRLSLIILGIWVLLGSLCYYFTVSDILSKKEAWGAMSVSLLLIGVIWLYHLHRKRKKWGLKKELENEIVQWGVKKKNCEDELSELELKMHINGMFLDKLFAMNDVLINKHYVMQSFTGNLLIWHEELQKEIKNMDNSAKDPFISLLSNKILDQYFEKSKQSIAKDLFLSDFIKEYEISEESIIKFQKNLKKSVIKAILSLVDDFKIFSHISKKVNYPFLDDKYADSKKLLPLLDKKSKVFLRLTPGAIAKTPHKVVFVRTENESDEREWKNIYPDLFNLCPASENISSPNKVIVVRILDIHNKDVDISES